MSMFETLNNAFPNHTHFYVVSGMQISEAMDRCARLTLDDGQVFHFNNQVIFAVNHDVETVDIPWLDPVEGSPHTPLFQQKPTDE